MGWFGPSKKEVWQQLCNEIGAEFVTKRWAEPRVELPVGPWILTLDTYTVSTGQGSVVFTRMRAPFVNPDAFRFTIYRKGLFTELGKLFGMQDIEIGVPDFDEAFVIKATDEDRIRSLLDDIQIRRLLQQQPRLRLEVRDRDGAFGPKFPELTDELLFQVMGLMKDKELLKGLFDLFATVLERLVTLGSATKDDPNVRI